MGLRRRARKVAGMVTAAEITAGTTGRLKEISPEATLLVIDPHVMDVTVMDLEGNTPGGLAWYPFLNLLAACFEGRNLATVHLLPRPLPRKDEYPAFVLARLVSHVLALALKPEKGRKR